MGVLLQEFRRSIRSLRKAPGFTLIAISTLALGIAANIIVFSIVDAVILRPLPVRNTDRIVVIRWQDIHVQHSEVSAAVFFLLKDHSQALENVAAVYPQQIGVNLSGVQTPQYVRSLRVSENFFHTLGSEPALGRVFSHADDQAGAAGTAVVSHRLWKGILNRDPQALGRVLKINGAPFTIIGIMPEDFRSYPDTDLWIPLQLNPINAAPGSDYLVLADVRAGIPVSNAERELDSLVKANPVSYLPGTTSADIRLRVERMQDLRAGKFRDHLTILFGAVLLVLLTACANLAVLVLVRGFSRTQELAIRAALGSTRSRLLRVFLIETILLAMLGGTIGAVLAVEVLPLALSFVPADLLQSGTIAINQPSLLFGLTISLLTALLVGIVPSTRVAGAKIQVMLQQAQRGNTPSLRQTRLAQALVAIETALAVILLGTALLLLRSFLNLEAVSPGFDPRQVWVAQVALAGDRYTTAQSCSLLVNHIADKLQTSIGVDAVGTITGLPLEKGLNLPVYPSEAPEKIEHAAEYRMVTGDYFKTLHIQVVAGRHFVSADDAGRPIAIINQNMARRWWPGGDAIGHFVRSGEEVGLPDMPREIVGIVADVHETDLGRVPPSVVFVPARQVPDRITAFANKLFLLSIVVRIKSGQSASRDIRDAVLSADPDLSIASLHPMADVVTESLSRPMFYAWLTSSFALFALFLTGIGVYGLLSYQVSLRTPEIGLRMAVGATRPQILMHIVKRGIQPSLMGMILGLIGSAFLGKILSSMLYSPHFSFQTLLIGETTLWGSFVLLSILLAASRASAMEPMRILRNH